MTRSVGRAPPNNAHIFAYVGLNAQGHENIEELVERISGFREDLECYIMMGSIDILLRTVAADIEDEERFYVDKPGRALGINEIISMVV